MIGVGHAVECTAASHSGTVKVKVILELTGGEISNQDEGRFIPSLPITVMKAPSSQRRNMLSVEYDEKVLIID